MWTTPRLLVLLLAAGALVFGLLDVRQRARLDRGLSRHRTDFTVYTEASKALYEGKDPYEARSPRGWRYVYPPLLAVLVRPLLALPVEDAAFLWYLLSVAALAWAFVATARAIGPPDGARSAALAALVCAGFLVQTFQRGQVTILLLALQAGGVLAFLRGRDLTAGLLLAAGTALRVTPLLLAGGIGVACLRRLFVGEASKAFAFPAGLLLGLFLAFIAVPALFLGPARASEVTKRWVESGRSVYASEPGRLADLRAEYAVTEDSFKNQSVRRVLTSWATGDLGRSKDDSPLAWSVSVDRLAFGVGLLVLLAGAALGAYRVGRPPFESSRAALAVLGLLPVLVTRYAWPVHFATALPFVAEGISRGARGRLSAIVFAAGVALFYAAHAEPLRVLADAGVLLFATALAISLLLFPGVDAAPPLRGPAP